MKAIYIFAVLGVNAIAYSVLIGVFFGPDHDDKKIGNKLTSALKAVAVYFLLVVSFPGCILFGGAMHFHANRVFDTFQEKMKRIRTIASYHGKPPDWEIKYYGFDCDRFMDEFGKFDLHSWQKHEYEKLGL